MSSRRNKVIIIGAGISGLSAGCHLASSGYETEIHEMHSLPGGLCTAWKRGPYLFDDCIHWLPGVTRASRFYDINDEVLDLSSMQFVRHDTVMTLEALDTADPSGNKTFYLYGNIDKLEAYLWKIAPEDGPVTKKIIGICRYLAKCNIPPTLDPPEMLGLFDKIGMLRHLPLLLKLAGLSKITMQSLSAKTKSPFLREVLQRISLGKDYPAVVQFMQVAFSHQGSAATPLGGSLAFARRIEQRFLNLGGKIVYKSRIKKILTENGRACGIENEHGQKMNADIVISAADGHWTLYEALEGKHLTPQLSELYALKKLEPFESIVYVSLGLRSAFTGQVSSRIFFFPEPKKLCDGSEHSWLLAHLVNFDPAQAPEGKSVINVMLLTRKHEYWESLRTSDPESYAAKKESAKDFVVDILEEKIGGIKTNLETWDVATPATFIRYTGNWLGSYEGWYPDKNFLAAKPLPRRVPSLRDFYMIGQWTEAGGGITPCIKSGRDIARIICRKDTRTWIAPNKRILNQ
ncbi:MAG TPA: NAD(P)/FAD-dependent oxidoreductase [Chitinispirillaceae bacterium]|nr:NAD(P)/FAD-dependent oxidoreductase [Chitinispirillaceae bacterium]